MKPQLAEALLESVVKIGRQSQCEKIMLIGADAVPDSSKFKALKKKVIFATPESYVATKLRDDGFDCVLLPGFTAGRTDRLKAALVGAVSAGLLKTGEAVVCAMTREHGEHIDSVMLLTAGEDEEEHTSLIVASVESDISAQLFEVLVNLGLRIGREGYEGRPVGTLIIVGDSTTVMEHSHPLTLNPFQGYSEAERNLFDAHVRDAVLNFSMLDGAFVVRDDGVVLAAGRHIHVSEAVRMPLGFGARHTAAASITRATDALAIVVSQSSGWVRVFHDGEVQLEIRPSGRRTEVASPAPDLPEIVVDVSAATKKKAKKKTKKKKKKS